ncbi:LysM domain protein [Aspergillus bombycis]|uniref:LysM domain protein n=1 Tax=Aspergillus bombycis TaxID=109264 RepID=A0A1F7ZR35_9EURO|nr:LysM domain protein [Aspergillus bombycis]OGM41739.1 LysM domain protein [Aspergillus bombycis]
MILAQILGLSLFGSVNAATLGKRFSSAGFATGETDPNVNRGCTYWANSIKSTDTCAALERYYGITTAQLVSWNPSLTATDCTLNEEWSYCVEAPTVPTTTEKTTTTTETPATTTSTSTGAGATTTTAVGPSPTQTGLISSCNAFYYVQKDDSCWGIANSYGNFTVEQFYSWNPAVKADCSGLQPSYYVCVGVAGSTSSTTTSKATTASPTTTSAPHSPQQSGIISSCNNYYFVEAGDGCVLIATKHGITLGDFYAWNPAVGSSCSSLQAGYWVCVGVSGGTTTTHATTTKTTTSTTTAGTGPTPTQSGITADCSAYYQAQEGDDCWSIINKKYSYLTAAKFYEWNPAIGPSCSNLQQGYYYCVATKSEGPMPDTISSCAKWHLVASGDSCWSIEQQYSITSTQFDSWNPYVGSSCTTLWLGYYVCVGV